MRSTMIVATLLTLQCFVTIGEPSYREYRILSGTGGYPYTYSYAPSTYYPCSTYPYKCVLRYPSKYTAPAHTDDNVYITDMYGQTRVVGSLEYQKATAAGQCSLSSECRTTEICRNGHCVNPCASACGANADCRIVSHVPTCSCPAGYTGDPFVSCAQMTDPCYPSPCGSNTRCQAANGVPTCKCLPGYQGSPIAGCRHECETNSECGSHMACVEFRCQNPCSSQCGTNAECEGTRNHAAVCKCPRGYLGNPYTSCQPECTQHSDCPRSKPACHYNACKNPCDGVCGVGANCELRDITPVCSCPRDMTGDPFVRCRPFEKRDLCEPNPCGANSRCEPGYDQHNKERPVCTCLSGYTGNPLTGCVRGECTEDDHCPDSQACIDYKCLNPCIGQCGTNAICTPRRHLAVCTCPERYDGNALVNCYPVRPSARY